MTSSADRAINSLRTGHDSLTALVQTLTPEQIAGPSGGASEWSVAQVLSHLGSGAEIGLAGLEASLSDSPAPGSDFNNSVWDRWNAKAPQDQVADFVTSNEALVLRYEGLDDQTREQARVKLGFLPAPIDIAGSASFRLNEFTLHTWDVAVGLDDAATLAPEAVELILDVAHYTFGWLGRPGSILGGRSVRVHVHTTDPARDFGVLIGEKAELDDRPADADAELKLPAESWLRLVSGRLAAPARTPAGVSVSGAITLDQLRQIFPGY
jgi:uncharacterized protein (TIGR03083 family)